jgi:hypothetical protein
LGYLAIVCQRNVDSATSLSYIACSSNVLHFALGGKTTNEHH